MNARVKLEYLKEKNGYVSTLKLDLQRAKWMVNLTSIKIKKRMDKKKKKLDLTFMKIKRYRWI